jgi:catechol 2,3-dioxygenase-like lactoylglutathione lyase family enzyme
MIKNVRHTGIVAGNLQRMVKFYIALGFIEECRAIETGEYIEKVVNIESVKVEWVKMRAPDGFLLELLQYRSHLQSPKYSLANANDLGCSHVAFTVDEIEKACELICENGGKITNSPAISPNGKVKVVYCHDPEGVLLELVQEL